MRIYPQNSPEASLRFVIMCLVADGDLDLTETNDTALLMIENTLEVDSKLILQVLRDYLHDLRHANYIEDKRISLLRPEHVNQILQEIADPSLRLTLLALSLDLCKSDHALNTPELALFQHIMASWHLNLTDLETEANKI